MPTASLTRTTTRRAHRRHRPAGRPRATQELSVVTFNIGVAAEARATRILRWLRRRDDDLIVLSETNGGLGTELIRSGLEGDGYFTLTSEERGERGVLLASRLPVAGELESISVSVPARARGIIIDTQPQLALLGVYVPSRDRSPEKVARKQRFIDSLLASLEALPAAYRNRLLMLGDYNAVARHHEPALPGFFPYEYEFHDELARLGFSAAHELRPYGSAHPHSWIGRTGVGYLYDYAHLGTEVATRLRRCQYLHGPRQQRLSDHAALALRLELD